MEVETSKDAASASVSYCLFLCCSLGTIFWDPPFTQALMGTLDKAPVEGWTVDPSILAEQLRL
jgi:hypothetical protein